MFGDFFSTPQWRKASKCKKLLQQLHSHLNLLMNKNSSVSRLLRYHVAESIRDNDQTRALIGTKELVIVENSISVYGLLLEFTDFILLKFDSIKKQKFGGELLDDKINEAVSSLVFASTRCGEEWLLEKVLLSIKKIFGQRYGQLYVSTALHLGHGNLVNVEIKEKLSLVNISEDVSVRLLEKLAKQYGLDGLEDTHEIEKHVIYVQEKKKSEEEISIEDEIIEDAKKNEEKRRRLLPKHVHPKLPDYDQIVDELTKAKNEEEERRILPKHVHPEIPVTKLFRILNPLGHNFVYIF